MTIYSQAQMRLSITKSTDGAVAFVQILGDVDLADSRALTLASRQLIDADAGIVYVDLAGTTFIGSTLIAFLVNVSNNGTMRRPMVLCRPTTMARRVIQMTGLDELAIVRPDLPMQWPARLEAPVALTTV